MRFTSRLVRLSLVCLALASAPTLYGHAQALASGSEQPTSKVDFYAGYGFFHPNTGSIGGFDYQDVKNPNVTSSVAAYFGKYLGAQIEGSYFSGNGGPRHTAPASIPPAARAYTPPRLVPIARYPIGPFIPYIHVLGGGTRMNGPAFQQLTWGWGITAGGGLDLVLPYWNSRFAVRAIQADYQAATINYGTLGQASPLDPPSSTGGYTTVGAIKLSAGLVVRLARKLPLSL